MKEDTEEAPFREPSGNFKDILSRWDRKATAEEANLANNRSHIAGHAFRKDVAENLKQRKEATPATLHRKDLVAEKSTSHLEDPHAVALPSLDDDLDRRESPSLPSRNTVAAKIGMFNKYSNGEAPFHIPGYAKKPIVLQRSKTVGDQPLPTDAVKKTTTTGASPSSSPAQVGFSSPSLHEEGKNMPTGEKTVSKASRNWSKLKTVGLAAKASVRMKNRLNHRMPKNIYQKPLYTQSDFRPPQFDHTPDELKVIRKALRKNFVFADLGEKDLLPFMQAFEKCTFASQEIIIRQGSRGDYFYIIFDGKVVFDVSGTTVGRAGKGNSFGELALLYTCPRAATVTAQKDSTLFRVDQNTFRFILRNQTKKLENQKMSLLRGVDFFAALSSVDLEKLSNVMTPRVFTPDAVLCKKGEIGDAFYVLQEGEILITDISVGSTTYADQTLGPGQYFGERSLVTGEPRAANVIAKSHGVAFTIDRATFQKTVGRISDIISRSQDGRRLAGVELLQGANLTPKQIVALAQAMKDIKSAGGEKILQKGDLSTPALYFVREGSVKVEKKGKIIEVSPGGFFGEELLHLAVRKHMPSVPSPISAICIENTILAELRLSNCRSIFDVQLLAGRSSEAFSLGEIDSDDDDDDEEEEVVVNKLKALRAKRELSFKPKVRPKVELKDLEKIKMLGAGTFGQVWLVADKSKPTEEKSVFALKVQTKWDLVEEGQVEAVIQERNIMKTMFHPFIVDFVASFQDEKFVYMVIDLIQGGELFSRIHDVEADREGLTEDQAKFYSLCLADALAYLHRLGYVFRDLKPENVMLDNRGYPKLIDFGFAKHIKEKTFTLCGTPGYLPPEIVMSRGHDWSADHWSFGVLIYDMITGTGPFYTEGMDQMTLFQRIVEVDYDEPTGVSSDAKDIISRLLQKEPLQRLGSLSRGEEDILEHPWFKELDLTCLRSKMVEAPWIPKVKDPLDTSCFDNWDDLVDKMTEDVPDLSPKDAALFKKF